LYIFTFYISTLPFYSYFYKRKQPRRKGEISYLIFSFLNDKHLLAPKNIQSTSLEVLRPFLFLIWFSIRMLCPLYILDPVLWLDQPTFVCI